MFRALVTALPFLILTNAGLAHAEGAEALEDPEFRPFIYSALGPGAGHTSVAVGGRLLIIVPMLDVQVAHGITDRIDFEARLSTIGILNIGDIGIRARLVGDENLSLGVRADLTGMFFGIAGGDFAAGIGGAGAAPGLILSLGGPSTQVSFIMDAPIYFAAGAAVRDEGQTDSASATGLAFNLRPQVALETTVGKGTSLYLMGQAYVMLETGSVAPFFGIGATF